MPAQEKIIFPATRLTRIIKLDLNTLIIESQDMKLILVIFVILGSSQILAAEYAENTVEIRLKQITRSIHYVEGIPGIATDHEGFISNAGVVITGDGVVIFDALGTPSLAKKLVDLVRSVTDQPITRVIVSHYHADHIYGLQVFKEIGAKIYASEGSLKYLESEIALERLKERRLSLSPWVNEQTRLIAPDEIFETSTTFRVGTKKFTISNQGKAHSDGDIAMLVEPDLVLFSGDIIFQDRIPFIGNGDTRHWLEILEKIESTGLRALVPGHGPASFEPSATISLTREYLAYMRDVMREGVDELLSFDEVYSNADWSRFEQLPAFKEGNRINAYQVFLSLEQDLLEQ
ncbi:MAG: MBL fold metallo-hydrolase [bacterium]